MWIWLDSVPFRSHQAKWAGEPISYVSRAVDGSGIPLLTVRKVAEGRQFWFAYSDGTEFLVDRSGTEVRATWPAASTLEDTLTYLLGPVLGFVLRLRGIPCLHASAVSVGEQAVALLGPAGAGKSTTAAAFAKRGYPVLSDDIVTLREQDDALVAHPAYTHLRMWPESATMLFGSTEALPRLTPTWDKQYLDLTTSGYRFQTQPLPLAAVYVLDERSPDPSAPRVEAIDTRSALITLIANTYVNSMLDTLMRVQEFGSLARLVVNVPVRRVTPHADPDRLLQLCDAILEDFELLLASVPVDEKVK